MLGRAKEKEGRDRWLCRCECGTQRTVSGAALVAGGTKSCGCWRKERKEQRLEGQRFGRLVVEEKGPAKGGQAVWRCRCDCGNVVDVLMGNLKQGMTRSCGCLGREARKRKKIRVEGQRFGKLVVRERVEDEKRYERWRVVCDCGKETVVNGYRLRKGEIRHCGCGRREAVMKTLEEYKQRMSPEDRRLLEKSGSGEQLTREERKRRDIIIRLLVREKGLTKEAVGRMWGVTRERARQIVAAM